MRVKTIMTLIIRPVMIHKEICHLCPVVIDNLNFHVFRTLLIELNNSAPLKITKSLIELSEIIVKESVGEALKKLKWRTKLLDDVSEHITRLLKKKV